MNNIKAALQSQLSKNKEIIQVIEEEISDTRARKTYCDTKGYLEEEYDSHNYLKQLRKVLKEYVRIQQVLKQLMRD